MGRKKKQLTNPGGTFDVRHAADEEWKLELSIDRFKLWNRKSKRHLLQRSPEGKWSFVDVTVIALDDDENSRIEDIYQRWLLDRACDESTEPLVVPFVRINMSMRNLMKALSVDYSKIDLNNLPSLEPLDHIMDSVSYNLSCIRDSKKEPKDE